MAKRFYDHASVASKDAGFTVLLDTRELKTPARAALVLPTRALAQGVAAEWQVQGDEVAPLSMPMTRLVSTAIDCVAADVTPSIAAFASYGMSDLLCYRACVPDALVAQQTAAWDPMLVWVRQRFNLSFTLTSGLAPVAQPEETRTRLHEIAGADPFRITGLAHCAALLGSAVLGLALEEACISAEETYRLAFLDDLFQIDEWGADDEAMDRLTKIALEVRVISAYLSALKMV